jgi:DNA excision repair protein ERCC-4
MAENYLWDNQSPNPTSDVENPSPAANDTAEYPSNPVQDRAFSTSKAVKVALGLTAVAGAVALGVVLGLNSSSDETKVIQAASSASAVNTVVAENNGSGKATKSINQDFSASSGPLEAKVKMVSSSITNGYETCSDLEKEITEALKLYMINYIKSEAENSEMYANCDPDNENWYWEYYGYDDYYYHDHCE